MKKRRDNQQSIKEVLETLINTYRLRGRLDQVKIVNAWPKVVGENISKHTRDIRVQGSVLYVKVDSSVIREELSYQRMKIVEKINAELGTEAIDNIIFR